MFWRIWTNILFIEGSIHDVLLVRATDPRGTFGFIITGQYDKKTFQLLHFHACHLKSQTVGLKLWLSIPSNFKDMLLEDWPFSIITAHLANEVLLLQKFGIWVFA